jgi:hypothetical protein
MKGRFPASRRILSVVPGGTLLRSLESACATDRFVSVVQTCLRGEGVVVPGPTSKTAILAKRSGATSSEDLIACIKAAGTAGRPFPRYRHRGTVL